MLQNRDTSLDEVGLEALEALDGLQPSSSSLPATKPQTLIPTLYVIMTSVLHVDSFCHQRDTSQAPD
jgi:hypothetical protein